MSRLFTTSLVSSIQWFKDCPPSWKERAYESLHNTLARVWGEPNEAAALGIRFEKYLYSILKRNYTRDEIETKVKGSPSFQGIVKRYALPSKLPKDKMDEKVDFPSPVIQKKIKRFITVDRHEYCLYGKLDLYWPNHIEDIKTTSKLMDDYTRKYLDSFQHHLYCYITEIPDFTYFVVVFKENKEGEKEIHSTHEIKYAVTTMDTERHIIEAKIQELFIFFADHPELLKLYETKYCLY